MQCRQVLGKSGEVVQQSCFVLYGVYSSQHESIGYLILGMDGWACELLVCSAE